MQIPDHLPDMKWITILWGIYMVVWSVLESGLWLTVIAAVSFLLVLMGYLFRRVLPGRAFSTSSWLLLATFLGALIGLGSGLFTLALMAIKTGLHAHGPEYNAAEVNWVIAQLPLWTLVGLLTGLGAGLLLKARWTPAD